MRRREFISLIGTAVAAWPRVARAQQPGEMRRVGVLMNIAENDPQSAPRVSALVRGLEELGWSLGKNVQIDYRWAAGDSNLYRKYAPELVALASGYHSGCWRHGGRRVAKGDPYNPDRICGNDRSGQPRPDCEHGPARRQYHRIYRVRIRNEWEVVGVA